MIKATRFSAVALAAALILGASVQAQEPTPGTHAQVLLVEPLAGHAAAFEEGVRRHNRWSVEAGANWTWMAFYIAMGERTGQYFWGSFNHNLADFDQDDVDPQGSDESLDEHVAPHMARYQVGMMTLRPDLSITRNALAPLYQVYTIELKPGGYAHYEHFLQKIKDALVEMGVTDTYYFVYESGIGFAPGTWFLSFPFDSFADMESSGEGDALLGLLTAVYGDFEARALLDDIAAYTASEMTELYVVRPDLSVNLPEIGGS